MKPFYLLMLASVFVAGCAEEKPWNEDIEKKAADAIRGKYRIESMQWHGAPVDLDDDGLADENIMREFEALEDIKNYGEDVWGSDIALSTALYSWDGDNWAGEGIGSRNSLYVHLPVQRIDPWRYEQYVQGYDSLRLHGSFQNFESYYHVSWDEIIFADTISSGTFADDMDVMEIKSGGSQWKLVGYGELELTVNYLFHDFLSKELVRDRMTIRLKRIQYQ